MRSTRSTIPLRTTALLLGIVCLSACAKLGHLPVLEAPRVTSSPPTAQAAERVFTGHITQDGEGLPLSVGSNAEDEDQTNDNKAESKKGAADSDPRYLGRFGWAFGWSYNHWDGGGEGFATGLIGGIGGERFSAPVYLTGVKFGKETGLLATGFSYHSPYYFYVDALLGDVKATVGSRAGLGAGAGWGAEVPVHGRFRVKLGGVGVRQFNGGNWYWMWHAAPVVML